MKKEVARHLMDGYVEFTDGTFGVLISGIYSPVHEDEAAAHEPDMYVEEDVDDFIDMSDKSTCLWAQFYNMYNEDGECGDLLVNPYRMQKWDDVLDAAWEESKEMYCNMYSQLKNDVIQDMKTCIAHNMQSYLSDYCRVFWDMMHIND